MAGRTEERERERERRSGIENTLFLTLTFGTVSESRGGDRVLDYGGRSGLVASGLLFIDVFLTC